MKHIKFFIFIFIIGTKLFSQYQYSALYMPLNINSGSFSNLAQNQFIKAWEYLITKPNANWLRIEFSDYNLGNNSYIKITSLKDFHQQKLTTKSLKILSGSSAYFNGDRVKLELYIAPGDEGIFCQLGRVEYDFINTRNAQGICYGIDDRIYSVVSNVIGRIFPENGTGFVLSNGKILTAGHILERIDIYQNIKYWIQFNVPLSNENGQINHPSPEDQFLIDRNYLVYKYDQVNKIGNDWGIFYAFNQDGLIPFEKYDNGLTPYFDLIPENSTLSISGYGVDGPPPQYGEFSSPRNEYSETLQTDTGYFVGYYGTAIKHRITTTTGNSGSPILLANFGVVGIQTHGGCSDSNYQTNFGTAFYNNSELINAITNPIVSINQVYPDNSVANESKIGLWRNGFFETLTIKNRAINLSQSFGSQISLTAERNLFNNYKFYLWKSQYLLTDPIFIINKFSISNHKVDIISRLNRAYSGIVIKASSEELNSFSIPIYFKDPWLIDYPDPQYGNILRNQGMAAPFKQRPSPFNPDYTTNYNGDVYKGVFLNQRFDVPNSPYYSVRAISPQDIQLQHTGRTHRFYFQNWSASPQVGAEFQNANSLETPVVFKQENVTVSANFKGSLLSNSVNAFGGSSQRKIVKRNNEIHMVYESMGKIWYEYSSDNGRNWVIKNGVKAINGESMAKNPSIAIVKDANPTIIGIVYQEDNLGSFDIKLALYNHNQDQLINRILIKSLFSKSYNSNANPVIMKAYFWDEILIIWYEPASDNPFENPEGLYCVLGKIGNNNEFITIDGSYVNLPFTDVGIKNLNVSMTSINDIPIPKFYVAYEKIHNLRNSDVIYREVIVLNERLHFGSEINASRGSGFEINTQPNIIAIKHNHREIVHIGWVGKRMDPTTINFEEPDYYEKKAVFYSPSTPDRYFSFGDDVQSVSLNRSNNRWVFAWSRGNDLPIQYTDSRDIRKIYEIPNLKGVDVQLTNGVIAEDIIAFVINTNQSPYPIYHRAVYAEFIPDEIVVTENSREGIVDKEGGVVYYSIGDIEAGGHKIDFSEIPDTLSEVNLETANRYLVSKPFMVNDNSGFVYSIRYGVTDSTALKEALSNTDYITFRVELIDALTKEVLGVYDEVTYNSENVSKYENENYYVNTNGLGERWVQLRLVIMNNVDPYYALADKFSDAEYNLQKKKSYKEVSYRGILSPKEYNYALTQNYPNPFNPTTRIKYSVKEDGLVTIKLYDMLGREVAVMVNEVKSPGEYVIELDAQKLGLSSGVYLYQMKSGEYSSIKKLVYVK